MINREHALPVKRQAELVGISRGSVYYLPTPVPAAELALMRRIDELHLNHPYAGSRMLRDLLQREGVMVGRKHVGTLMRRMGIEALYCRPGTSKRHPGHMIYPYLLRHLAIRPRQPGHSFSLHHVQSHWFAFAPWQNCGKHSHQTRLTSERGSPLRKPLLHVLRAKGHRQFAFSARALVRSRTIDPSATPSLALPRFPQPLGDAVSGE